MILSFKIIPIIDRPNNQIIKIKIRLLKRLFLKIERLSRVWLFIEVMKFVIWSVMVAFSEEEIKVRKKAPVIKPTAIKIITK